MKSLVWFSLTVTLLLLCTPGRGQETIVHPLSTIPMKGQGKGVSEGFVLKEMGFDATGVVNDARELSGAVFMSYQPGTVWLGALPGFVASELEIGGEERVFCTDVYESGGFLFAHYGIDHYQTKAVSVIDSARREVALLTAFAYKNISRIDFDPESQILYFTTVEGNMDGKEEARLVAYSLKDESIVWKSDAGTAHGNFLVYDKHIVTHYGFTAEDDFVCVVDRGSGRTLKKYKIATAASHLLRGEGSKIVVPCYSGVLTFSFEEN